MAYTTKIVKRRMGDARYNAPMRGLLHELQDYGVVGSIIGIEFTNGGGIGDDWNTHIHCFLLGDTCISIPESAKDIDEEYDYIELGEQNAFSKRLARRTGFGPQYQYTAVGGITDVMNELSKLTYGIKVKRFGDDSRANDSMLASHAEEIGHFYDTQRPRLLRRYDECRISWERKVAWAMSNIDEPGAEYILGYESDTRYNKELELHHGYHWVNESGHKIVNIHRRINPCDRFDTSPVV